MPSSARAPIPAPLAAHTSNDSSHAREGTPPPGLRRPALLQLISYVTRPFEHFKEQQARFGDVFTVRLPGVGDQVIVASPEGIKALVTGSYEAFDREADSVRFLIGGNALIF